MDFRLLGPLEVRAEGRILPIAGAKQRALLTLLVLNANRVVSIDRIVDALWGDIPPRTAKHTISVFVSDLRRALAEGGDSPIVRQAPGYVLAVEPESVDVAGFERLVAAGRAALEAEDPLRAAAALDEALDLWRGPPLADTAYESFAQGEIARLEELRLVALEARADAELALGRHEELAATLRALIGEHPLRERLRGQLMIALYRSGRQAEALEVFQQARRVLVDELGIEPGAELVRLEKAILNQDSSLRQPSVSGAAASPLPAPLTELVDRVDELGHVAELLRSENVRLVTLTGAGGTGKTRLAVEVARRCEASFAAGAAFVPLETIADPALVPSAVAQSLGVREACGEPIDETVERFLRSRELLLVVDNFEQLLPAAPIVVRLLAAAPDLTVLATSRARLRVRGEHEVPVPPLPLPVSDGHTTPELVLDAPAVQLFVVRAKAARPDFEVTADNAAAVAGVCTRVDGLPLALELAAAASKILTPEAQLARLERRLDTLTGGASDLPSRQQTLRGTIAWSCDLLPESARVLFARIAVFAGEFGLDAAEAVSGPGDVFGQLALLVDHSLVLARTPIDATPRFAVLPTIREFAQELLEASGEQPVIARRHAEHYLALAEQADPELWSKEQAAWLARLDREHANLRTALGWWRDAGEPEGLMRLAIALRRWWGIRGYLSEGMGWIDEALGRAENRTPLLVRGLHAARELAQGMGDRARVRQFSQQQLELAEELGDPLGAAFALSGLGSVCAWEGDYDRAVEHLRRGVELFTELGDEHGQARVLVDFADLELIRGDYARARAASEQALAIYRRLGDRRAIAITLLNLGFSLLSLDCLAEARAAFLESLAISDELGDTPDIAFCLEGLAGIAVAEGDHTYGIRLLGRSEALRESTGTELGPFEQRLNAETTNRARSTLGGDPFLVAFAEGRTLPLEAELERVGSSL